MSIPDLLLQLCNSVSQQPSLQQKHRETCYRILLGLHEVCREYMLSPETSQHQQAGSLLLQVDWDEVEDTDRLHLNGGWIQEVTDLCCCAVPSSRAQQHEHLQASFGLKQKGWEKESQQLHDLFAEFGRCHKLQLLCWTIKPACSLRCTPLAFRCSSSGPSQPNVGPSSEPFTERQAVLSLLLHLRVR